MGAERVDSIWCDEHGPMKALVIDGVVREIRCPSCGKRPIDLIEDRVIQFHQDIADSDLPKASWDDLAAWGRASRPDPV